MFILTKATSQVFSKITNTNNLSRNLFQILFSPRQSLIIIFGTIISIERESRGKKFYFYSRGLARPPRFDGTRSRISTIQYNFVSSRSFALRGASGMCPSALKILAIRAKNCRPWGYIALKARWMLVSNLETVRSRSSFERETSVCIFLSKISFSNGVERDWYLLFKNFSWEKFYNKVRQIWQL